MNVKDPKTLVRVGLVGTVLVALCCFTPILVILLGVVGLSALTGYFDYILFPALTVFIGLIIYAIWRNQKVNTCHVSAGSGEKK